MWPIGLMASTCVPASRPIGTPTARANSATRLKFSCCRRSHQMPAQLTITAARGTSCDQFKCMTYNPSVDRYESDAGQSTLNRSGLGDGWTNRSRARLDHGELGRFVGMPSRRVVIDHLSIGVTDVRASRRFYLAALAPLG